MGVETACCRLVRTSHKIARLPAVPTQDWCDQAATAIAELLAEGVGIVRICEVSPSAGSTHTWIGGVGTPPSFGSDARSLVDLRCRLDATASREWDFGIAPVSLKGQSRQSTANETGPLEPGWRALGIDSLVIGAIAMSPDGPHLLAAVGSPTASPTQATVESMGAILPLLAEVARNAIGCARRRESDWVTVREQEVLDLLVMGYSVREIASQLSRSPHTVHDHVKSLHRKLHASSRGQLVAMALGRRTDERAEPGLRV